MTTEALTKINEEDSHNVCKKQMPKDMSDWFDERIDSDQNVRVKSEGKLGYAMKSERGTIVFFPNWNCITQFKDIANKLRK